MKRLLTALVGLLLLALLIYHCIHSRAPVIEADVRSCVSTALARLEAGGIEVAVDGRDVTLSGNVASEARRQQAEAAADGDCGARAVTNSLAVVDLPPYETRLCLDDHHAELTGNVSSAAVRDTIVATAERVFHEPATGGFVLRSDAPDGHGELLPLAVRELGQLDSGCITLSGNEVFVKGSIRSDEARERLVTALDAAAGSRFTTRYELEVPQRSEHAALCEAFYAELLAPGEVVLFDFDSSALHEEGEALLRSLVDRTNECSEYAITVTGHADSTGDAAYNRDLSERRAEAVVEFLVGNGVQGDNLDAEGYGESQPRADNATEEGRAQNRRIEFRVREID